MATTKLALITTFDDAGGPTPGHDLPSGGAHPWLPGFGGGGHPSQGLPSGGAHPWLPGHLGGGHPSQGLPSGGAHPWLPGHLGGGGHPSQPIYLPVFPTDPTKPTPPEAGQLPAPPEASTKPIAPGDTFVIKCTIYGFILVRQGEGAPTPTP